MVSVERLKPVSEFMLDWFLPHNSWILESKLHSDFFEPLFFDGDFCTKEDVGLGHTFIDSRFPLYDGIRRSRYHNQDIGTAHHEKTEVTKPHQKLSDPRVIPIQVEHNPDSYTKNRNVKFQLKDESSKDVTLAHNCLQNSAFPDSITPPVSKCGTSANSNESQSNEVIRTSASFYESKYGLSVESKTLCDSRCTVDKSCSKSNTHEDKSGAWKCIPVDYMKPQMTKTDLKIPNSNNNSSSRNDRHLPTKSAAVTNDANSEDEIDFSSVKSRGKDSIIRDRGTSFSSKQNDSSSDPEFDESNVTVPPNYPIYDVLRVLLSKDNRQVDYIKADGNCFFRALSKQLHGTEKYHKGLRSCIVDIIASNVPVFAQFVDGEDVQTHVMRMSENHCWATTCEIYAAATFLQNEIFMLVPNHLNENYSWLLFKPLFMMDVPSIGLCSRECYITLCNTNGNHYDRIVPLNGGCNCILSEPKLGGLTMSIS